MVQVEHTWTYIIVYADDRLSSTKVTMLYNVLLCTIVVFMGQPIQQNRSPHPIMPLSGVPLLILLQESQCYLDGKHAVNFVAYKNDIDRLEGITYYWLPGHLYLLYGFNEAINIPANHTDSSLCLRSLSPLLQSVNTAPYYTCTETSI